jgi:hypothetical protein
MGISLPAMNTLLPKLRGRATDLDRKEFLREGFRTIQMPAESHAWQMHIDQPHITVDVELITTITLEQKSS